MEWWNFSNIPFVTLFFILLIFLGLTIFLAVTYFLSASSELKDLKKYKDGSLTTRVYVIDVKKNVVTYFNKNDIRHKRKIDMNGFYQRFNTNDVAKVKTWIFDICLDFKSVDPYLEVRCVAFID